MIFICLFWSVTETAVRRGLLLDMQKKQLEVLGWVVKGRKSSINILNVLVPRDSGFDLLINLFFMRENDVMC